MVSSSILRLVLTTAGVTLGATGCGSVPASGDGGGGGTLDARELDGAVEDASVVDGGGRPDGLLGTAPVHALQPLQVGTTWTWQMYVSPVIFLLACTDGSTHEQSVLRSKDAAGRSAVFLEALCGDAGQGNLLSYGEDSVDELYGDAWGVWLSGPLLEGRAWTTASGQSYFWQSAPVVETALGTFRDCWRVVGTDLAAGGRTDSTHCPSVGPVLIEVYSGADVLVRASLIAFSSD